MISIIHLVWKGELALNRKLRILVLLAGVLALLLPVMVDAQSTSAQEGARRGVQALFFASEEANYIYVTVKPNNQQGILYQTNVTALNGLNVITSGISNTSGVVTLTNVPYGDITFVAYAGSDYSQIIANQTLLVSMEGQSFDLTCDQNYGDVSISWSFLIDVSLSTFIVSLPLFLSSYRISVKKEKKTGNTASQRKLASPSFREGKQKKGE
ncbi:MAG: hypothetical protein PVF15_07785 [Candidatus Bathyarchaeota archaeon]|jgi:hypothetical protein